MPNFTYIDKGGKSQVVEANDPNHAISIAPNIASDSGVALETTTPAPAPAKVTAGDAYKDITALGGSSETTTPFTGYSTGSGKGTFKGSDGNLYNTATGEFIGPAPVTDEGAYRNDVLSRFQKEIDANNQIYAEKLNEAKVQGIGNLGSARAIAAARGSLGTDIGEADKKKVIADNTTGEDLIRAQQSAKIDSILGLADQTASSEIAAKNAAAKSGLDTYLSYIKEAPNRIATNVNKVVDSMITNDTDPSNYDPAQLQTLAQKIGTTVGELTTAYKKAKSESQAASLKAQKDSQTILSEGQTVIDADGKVIAQGADKASPAYQEYKNYISDEASRGNNNPISFDQYQTRDANRKAKIAAAAQAGVVSAAQANIALKLSDDYEARSKDFYTVRDNYNKVVASATDPSPAGDLSLIFAYMKTLDPTSVVREGEFATAQNAGSVPTSILAKYNQVVNGTRLTGAQRSDFVDRSSKLYNAAKSQQDQTKTEFSSRAAQYNVPESLVVRSTEASGNVTPTEVKATAAGIDYHALLDQGYTDAQINDYISKKVGPLDVGTAGIIK